MVRAITHDEINTYHRDGVVKLSGFVPADVVASMLAAIDTHCENPSEWYYDDVYVTDRCFGLQVPALERYLLDPVLGENAARAMNSTTTRFYFDHLFAFPPATPIEGHYWHQDLPYWPVAGEQVVSFWVALTPAAAETAALKFVAGSHQNRSFFRPRGFDGSPLKGQLPEAIETQAVDVRDQFLDEAPPAYHENPKAHGVTEFSYEAGDAVMFHPRVVHSSGGNTSPSDRRVAYSARFVGDDATMMLRAGVFQDPALLPDVDQPFAVGAPMQSRRWPIVHESSRPS